MENRTRPAVKYIYCLILAACLALLLLVFPGLTSAEIIVFERNYTYQASEADSKISCRTIAVEQVKKLLLEELGAYLESETEVKDFALTKDKITVLTAGIAKVDILSEEWNGEIYSLSAKIAVDPDDVVRSIDQLRQDRQKIKELEDTRKRADDLLEEVERLKKELTLAKADNQQGEQKGFVETIKELGAIDWFDRGYSSNLSGDYDDAVASFNKACELNPAFAAAYNNRGIAYSEMGNYQQAISDFDRVVLLSPLYAPAYYNRGIVYFNLGNQNQAIKDYSKAIKIDSHYANAYYQRGAAYTYRSNYKNAINDFTRTIKLNPNYPDAYRNRGDVYTKFGKPREAAKDYSRVAEIDNKRLTSAYSYNRTNRQYQPGNSGSPYNHAAYQSAPTVIYHNSGPQPSQNVNPSGNVYHGGQNPSPRYNMPARTPSFTPAPSMGGGFNRGSVSSPVYSHPSSGSSRSGGYSRPSSGGRSSSRGGRR